MCPHCIMVVLEMLGGVVAIGIVFRWLRAWLKKSQLLERRGECPNRRTTLRG